MFHVSDSMQLSGDLVLRGLPDQPGAEGSWVLMPLIQLVGAGSLTFQVGCSSWGMTASSRVRCSSSGSDGWCSTACIAQPVMTL